MGGGLSSPSPMGHCMLIITTQSAHGFQLSEFRDHVGIDYTDDDPALQRSLDSAVVMWEKMTRWFTRDTTFTLDWYDSYAPVYAGGGSLSLSSVARLEPDGTTTATVTSDWYLTRSLGEHMVRLRSTGTFLANNRYTGTFSVDVTDVEDTVRAAVYAIGNHLFMNRDVVLTGTILTQIPYAVRAIVGLYQRGTL